MSIEINGGEFTEAQLRYFFYRTFWKQTVDANLNTVPGCEQAATAAVDALVWLDNGSDIQAELKRFERSKMAQARTK